MPFCLLNLYMFWLASLWIFGLHNDNLFFSFLFFLTHDTFANLQTEKKLRRLRKYQNLITEMICTEGQEYQGGW